MTKRPGSDPAAAGVTLVATILLCSGAGLGLGLLVGAPVPLVLAGVFAGSIAGFALVYARYKDL
jgi:hypothetical protein